MKLTLQTLSAIILLCLLGTSCQKDTSEPSPYLTSQTYNLKDVAYGTDPQQKMDMYLPANRSSSKTKVFVMIHGGGWSAGDKADYSSTMDALKDYYPNHAIININYRLGTQDNPGYPKQIQDIQAALNEISKGKYNLSQQYLLFGGSAGAHLSMLYAYAFDHDHRVKGVINTVGPADLTDPSLTNNLILMGVVGGFLGKAIYDYQGNKALFEETSPARRVTPNAPPTLSFYGDKDPLIPVTQMPKLRTALENNHVWHYDTLYPGGGHGLWASDAQTQDYITRIIAFIDQFFK